jgi:hypothetical protein
MPFYVVVEGHGEVQAVPNLVSRLAEDLGYAPAWAMPPLRLPITRSADAEKAVGLLRGRQNVDGLLVLRDDEDGCPCLDGPELARWFADLKAPFPIAVTLFYREYETLFVAALNDLAGQPLTSSGIVRAGLQPGARFDRHPEGPRDAKGIITAAMPPGQAYKETTDQLALTRLLDFDRLRIARLPCFETLERAMHFLLGGKASPGQVFPLDR